MFFLRKTAVLLALGGYPLARGLGSCVGFLLWHCVPSRRKLAIETIMARLELPREKAVAVARASFTENARSFLEILLIDRVGLHNNPKLAYIHPEFIALMNEQRPVVGATAHFGAWELLAGLLGEIFTDRPRQIVVRRQRNPAMNAFIAGQRGKRGGVSVNHRNAAPKVLAALKQNGLCAFLVDHNCPPAEAVFLPFLGLEAAVNVGPALLALRAKAVVYPVFLRRDADGRYTLIAHPPLDTTTLTGTIGERTRQIAEFYTKSVEQEVRAHPEQWFWMHKRWKTRPTD